MPDDAKEEETLWRALEDPVLECNSTRIWMAITDYQEEGKFINVSRFTHTDVFVDNAIVGSTLNDERWGENQPGGGVSIEYQSFTHTWYRYRLSFGIGY